ncbi:MAG: endo-1,4-beta-xylanase [Lachnospiraceae bacterium]|nr:endo-1,4-beta-xylanase [Lachnospiraceae bacterium]
MKKVRSYFAACMILTLLCGACGTAQTGTELIGAPDVTEAPAVTESQVATETPVATEAPKTPEVTEAPKVTEAPAATEAPVATEVPAVTETPVATEAPAVTEVPTTTEAPAVSETPQATATPVPTKAPAKSGDVTYTFNDLKYVASYGVNYTINKDGSIDLQYEGQWQEIKFRYPEGIDMTKCTGVTVKAKSEYGVLAFKLFGETFLADPYGVEEYIFTECKGSGVKEYKMQPILDSTLYGLGIMAMDAPADASAYKATIYSITFHMDSKNVGPVVADSNDGDITYDVSGMTCQRAYYSSCSADSEGGLRLQFNKQWGEVRLILPEGIDLSQCVSISVKMNTYGNNLSFLFFDKKALNDKYCESVEVRYTCNENGTAEYLYVPTSGKEVFVMGFMSLDDVTNPEDYVATVYSVTFRMASGAAVQIPTDIAPDVTEDMTLLNTYGSVFGKIGTAVSLDELKNPAGLAQIKKQYNSITSGWQAKMDQVIVSTPTLISVAEAKKLGYVIPDNYKESMVPKFDFTVLDETMKICYENDLYYRVHTLIWHQQALDWFFREGYKEGTSFVSPEVMDARMEMYIRTVMEHVCDSPYVDIVYAWDVVNEYLHFDNVAYENYTAVYGPINEKPEFVKLAFEIADDVLKKNGRREQISLFYNDYDTYTYDWEEPVSNKDQIISLVNFINSDSKVCDGVGMQSHFMEDRGTAWKDFKATAKAFLDAGLEVQITELDVNLIGMTEEKQAEIYVTIWKGMLELKKAGGNISAIVCWGVADNVAGVQEATPLMFYYPDKPKDVYYEVLQAYLDAGFKVR